jgi:hypothetical protein
MYVSASSKMNYFSVNCLQNSQKDLTFSKKYAIVITLRQAPFMQSARVTRGFVLPHERRFFVGDVRQRNFTDGSGSGYDNLMVATLDILEALITTSHTERSKNMLAPELAMPPVGYSIAEVENILGIPHKTGYRLVKEGKLEAFVGSTGKLRVSPYVLYAYMKVRGELD